MGCEHVLCGAAERDGHVIGTSCSELRVGNAVACDGRRVAGQVVECNAGQWRNGVRTKCYCSTINLRVRYSVATQCRRMTRQIIKCNTG